MTKEQLFRIIQSYLGLVSDGIAGPKTLNEIVKAMGLPDRSTWRTVQAKLGVTIDGIAGSKTAQAVYDCIISLDYTPPVSWPKESEVESFFGKAGSNLITIDLPYSMLLSWDLKMTVAKMTVHKKVAESVKRIFQKTIDYYGFDKIKDLGLDIFGGSYNDRNKVGGTTKSMHAYGIAIDLDPDNNQLKWGRDKARLAKSDYNAFWGFVESEGARSLGRTKNYDWMHFQFTK